MKIRLPAGLVRAMVRLGIKPFLGPPFPVAFQRFWAWLMSRVHTMTKAASTARVELDGLRTLRAQPKEREPERVVLYLHGGGYCIGSWATQAGLISRISVAADAVVYAPNYRLAPEHPHPAALHDALRAYRWLLERGIAASNMALAGDSAGGGLALATAVAARNEGLPMPGALVLISPWVDLRGDTPSMTTNASIDPMLRVSWSRQCARQYLNGRDPEDPACSPLFANHRGLPPTLIHVGSDEVILDDSTRLAARCKDSGVDVTLRIFQGMWHEFQIHAGMLREADEAVVEIGEFVKHHLR